MGKFLLKFYEFQVLFYPILPKTTNDWMRYTWFKLMDCKLQFAIHPDCFAEHFLLLFMKFVNQF